MRRVAAVLLAALGSSQLALAEPDRQRGDALIAEAHKLSEAGDYEAACRKLEKANAVAPGQVGTMLDLGVCYEHLKKYATALSWLRRTRAVSHQHGEAKPEAAAAALVTSAEARVATAQLAFHESPPRGTKVTVDGYPLPAADYGRVELDAGHHAIDVTAPHFKPAHVELDIADAESQTVDLPLEPEASVARAPAAAQAEVPASHPRRLARYVATGGGAAVVVSGLVALYARNQYLQCVRDGVPLATCSNGQDAVATANHYHNLARWVATPLFVGGAAALGYAAYLYFTAPPDPPDHVSWVPVVGADALGLAAVGRF